MLSIIIELNFSLTTDSILPSFIRIYLSLVRVSIGNDYCSHLSYQQSSIDDFTYESLNKTNRCIPGIYYYRLKNYNFY